MMKAKKHHSLLDASVRRPFSAAKLDRSFNDCSFSAPLSTNYLTLNYVYILFPLTIAD